MGRNLIVIGALLAVLALPFVLRPKQNLLAEADDTLVIVSPHNEAIRYEFSRAFGDHYKAATGRSVRIDWRIPGGTSEISKFIQSEYSAAFQYYWTRTLGRPWTAAVENGFSDHRVVLPEDPAGDDEAQAARRAFLNSEVTSGMDLFFGGGRFDFDKQAKLGNLIDSGILNRHPTWFGGPDGIPQVLGGEEYWDKAGRWIGTCVSAFGIVYNRDTLERLKIETPPAQWADLAGPRYTGQIAIADPTKSGSAAAAFEMLIQQQMQESVKAAGGVVDERRLEEGWANAMQVIRRIAANARYFTDSASKIPLDVSLGDAAAGMAIDFYGRYQSESVRGDNAVSRMEYVTPVGGTSIGSDPIGMLRGAPNRAVAEAFMDFVMSEDGQKLWNFKVGTPGGPEKFSLRWLPIVPSLYDPQFTQYRADPDVNPYELAKAFEYHREWTGSLFSAISFTVRVMCLDAHHELKEAWLALQKAGFPPKATAKFNEIAPFDYASVKDKIAPALRSADRIQQVILARELGQQIRKQYHEVTELAERGE